MPDLRAALLSCDAGHLSLLAERWGVELPPAGRPAAVETLSASFLTPNLLGETLDLLPSQARYALRSLVASGGRIPWAEFTRRFGPLREMGPARRDREQPHRHPISSTETLYYHGLLYRAFFDAENGPQEFAYLPDDLLALLASLLPSQLEATAQPFGRPATPIERTHEILAADHILDDATTLLAALRLGNRDYLPFLSPFWRTEGRLALPALLQAAGLINAKHALRPEAVKTFLESPRQPALALLSEAWKSSRAFNELRLIPTLQCEGEWTNDPLQTRRTLLSFLTALPPDQWWSLPAFLRDLKRHHPDFQRPAGDYDSWFIKRVADGQYLRGFAYWDAVEGALIRFLIQIMHHLGLVDLAAPEPDKEITAFRMRTTLPTAPEGEARFTVLSNGRIIAPRYASRAVRYQIARFCEWEEPHREEYRYYVSAHSLRHATEQGLKAGQLLSLLAKATQGKLPPSLIKALKRWERFGSEARVETYTVLRVARPEVLEELRNSKAARFLGEPLGPTAVIVPVRALPKIAAALADLGILLEVRETPGL